VLHACLALFCSVLSPQLFAAATTPNPGLRYYYPSPTPVIDIEADVVVYGGTSGGVVAAVQARRMGKSVALVVFGRHVGGMTSGGLTSTDGVNAAVQGGLTREFFKATGNSGFLPSRAEAEFEKLLADPIPGVTYDAPIPTYYEQRLASVEKRAGRITALRMENGSTFRGRMFIDCTYEGDLMARAGVSYTVGRESSAQYGESRAGRRGLSATLNGVSPYLIPGDTSSGLIHGVSNESQGPDGIADNEVQAYNFRMFTVLNANPATYLPFPRPPGYDPAFHELVYRNLREGGSPAMTFGNDINNHELFNRRVSTDYVGQNKAWPDADYATRETIFQNHVRWQLGMLWYLRNDPRFRALATDASVSSTIRSNIQSVITNIDQAGLSRTEYPETGGWPHELYVREARRMVSDLVLTQAHYDRLITIDDPVSLANYTADSHDARRLIVMVNGVPTVANEGDTGGGNGPVWRISYRALIPKKTECENLFVPWAVSASHVAFASLRMEPCFMVSSQSAATAAALAIDAGVAVQDLDYATLKLHLLAGGQLLGDEASTATPQETVVDNLSSSGVTLTGSWTASSSVTGYIGTDYLHDSNTGTSTSKSVRFTPTLPTADNYEIFLRWTSFANRATNVPVTITHAGGSTVTSVNQTLNGSTWYSVGTYAFDPATSGSVTVHNTGANGFVIADAARFVPTTSSTGGASTTGVNAVAYASSTREGETSPAIFRLVRTTATITDSLTVAFTVSGTAQPGLHYASLPTQITIPANTRSAELLVTPIADSVAQGTRTVTLTVQPSDSAYALGPSPSATVTLLDKPFDGWRHTFFGAQATSNQPDTLATADPDRDGLPNKLEFFLGSDPLRSDSMLAPQLRIDAGTTPARACFDYTRSGLASAIPAKVQWSTSLSTGSWTDLTATPETRSHDPATGDRQLTASLNISPTSSVFFRLVLP
jgi:hypothetical protein